MPHLPQLVLHFTAVAAMCSVPPDHHGAIAKDGSKSTLGRLGSVACSSACPSTYYRRASSSVPPGHHETIVKDGKTRQNRLGFAAPSAACLALRCAVAAMCSVPPDHHGAMGKNGSKRTKRGLDLLHVPQLVSHPTAVAPAPASPQVTAEPWSRMAATARSGGLDDLGCNGRSSACLAPHCCCGHTRHSHRSPQNHRQGWQQRRIETTGSSAHSPAGLAPRCCRHLFQHDHRSACLALHCCCRYAVFPQTTTEPWARMAANLPREAWICCTFLSLSLTLLLSRQLQRPPRSPRSHGQGWQQQHPQEASMI